MGHRCLTNQNISLEPNDGTMEKMRLTATATVFLLIILASTIIFLTTQTPHSTNAPIYSYNVEKTYLHNPQAFTEGLVFDGNFLIESNWTQRRLITKKNKPPNRTSHPKHKP